MIPTPKRSIITNKSLKHARHVLNCCRIVGGIKNKNIKKQPWGNCPKDKNRSPFHGEKPLMIKYFLEGGCIKSNDFAWYGRDIASAPNG